MSTLDWSKFCSLPGSKNKNFEDLCRALININFRRFGQFYALKNQPGVEFHLRLFADCYLGGSSRWYGWQCKYHELTSAGKLKVASKRDIENSLKITEKNLPELTDWVLWTPYTLSKSDQDWFMSLQINYRLHMWTDSEIDTYIDGSGLFLRRTYFGDLIITSEDLEFRHRESVQPIRERWLEPVHQIINAERIIRRMLGEPGSWNKMIDVGFRLKRVFEIISDFIEKNEIKFEKELRQFILNCNIFADTLLNFHKILAEGDLEVIQARLSERKMLIDSQVCSIPRWLRNYNMPIALDATNALSDMRIAQELLDEVEEFLGVGLVAILADAGGGKTQMSAQITSPQDERPAGILLYGRNLHRGQTLDDLVSRFSINGISINNMENLLAALDAAGKRSKCRLPIFIDGLNEAENPKDWKELLAILSETIKRYPNVLVVCTIRTGEHRRENYYTQIKSKKDVRATFVDWALPDRIKLIKIEGFGGDTKDAINKYFKYYKINPGNTEIPIDFLQHPLSLRIFCEVTNPKRESEVKIEYFPASLTPLLEKYVDNACERISQMVNLSHSYTNDELKLAVYKLGLELWKAGKNEIFEADYKESLSNTTFQWNNWDSNIINLFAQEGIVFRNPGKELGEYLIMPTYDALGGYIIGNSLLIKYASDIEFKWLKESEVVKSFIGENNHQLAFDIFRSLVTLTPRRLLGMQLWMESPEQLRKAALRLTTEIEAEYLDKNTVCEILNLFKNDSNERKNIFSRLQRTRGAIGHPFNSEFLDSILRELSISDRDLGWTEWIRESKIERLNDLLEIEVKWRENLEDRTMSDGLRAKWIIWFLTSTDHELRNLATRALYWFGRGNPVMLFKESLSSIQINDPYIPERMFAASYGVAMARNSDIGDKTFINETLPEFALELYKLMFSKKAKFYSTHFLMRKYAVGIIEIASLHNSTLFSNEEIKNCKPPFNHHRSRDWGETKLSKEEESSSNSPFRMDFENYVLGSLVPERNNYDFKQYDYKKIYTQVLWRVKQLGWSPELFKDVDQLIESEHYRSRVESDAKRVDRYGKKYSWIAYYEMYGYLFDKKVFKHWQVSETPIDIDPSFPENNIRGKIIEDDFLGDSKIDTKDWIANGSIPSVDPYLIIDSVHSLEGPWIALDGFLIQQDEKRGRKIFCYIRSFLISNKDISSFYKHLSCQDLGGRWLPEKLEVSCTFAGEIPWSENFPQNSLDEFSFIIKEETEKVTEIRKEFYLDNKKLKASQLTWIYRYLSGETTEKIKGQQQLSDDDLDRIEMRDIPFEYEKIIKREYKKFNTIIPVCDFNWRNYMTTEDYFGHITILAKEIAIDLELIGQPQNFNLFAKEGKEATFYISDQSNDFNNHQSLFFIREDLLKNYLKTKDLSLVWAIWGEREYSSEQVNKLFSGPNRPEQPYVVFNKVKLF